MKYNLEQVYDILAEQRDVELEFLPLFQSAERLVESGELSLDEAAIATWALQEDASDIRQDELQEIARDLSSPKEFSDMMEEVTVSYSGGAADPSTVAVSNFGRARVYDVDDETFGRARMAKEKRERFNKYVGRGPISDSIRQYSKKNPTRSIMLRNSKTNAYTLLKRGSQEVW